MSYQVLARKWRPSKFAELVGQEHVKLALINGLTNQRLHHAYLFTGTRGVGKTTIARIFAKSLNCETGISAEPCGQCSTCLDVDAGRFVDLIEIDAASRTKVADTREILDNVQYAPTRGRFKVYLIDEVHMLSRHSFNALLKTLEEPPEHVKFLLATTDPQKLPVTILSRCLQFNLQALSIEQIDGQLQHILQAEQIQYEPAAINLLAKSAKGSMRDSLSLTDQAIAQSGQNVQLSVVQQMLGTVDVSWSQKIIVAIANNDPEALQQAFVNLNKQYPDATRVLDDLITLCHQVALTQVMPQAANLSTQNAELIQKLAGAVSPQLVQVYYQILLQGKKELTLVPEPLAGLEMVCLRLLAFNPVESFETSSEPQVKKNTEASKIELPEPQLAQATEPSVKLQQTPPNVEPEQLVAAPETQSAEPEPESQPPQLAIDSDNAHQEPAEATTHEEQELAAQQSFYHDLALSQGYQPSEPEITNPTEVTSQVDMSEPQPIAEIEQPAPETEQPQAVTEQLADEPAAAAPVEPVSKAFTTSAGGSDLAQFDNPVLAILAARNEQANQQVSETPVQAEPETRNEPESVTTPQASNPEESIPQVPKEDELKTIDDHEVRFAHEVDPWASLIERSNLAGLGRQLALNSSVEMSDSKIELTVKQDFAHLLNDRSEAELTEVVALLKPEAEFVINKSELIEYSPAAIQSTINGNRQERAEQSIQQDPLVQSLINDFDGKIVPESIKPL